MRFLVPMLALVFAAACSGGNGDTGSSASQPDVATGGSNAPAGGDGAAGAAGRAIVTIGTETFEFDVLGNCVTIGGQVTGDAELADAEVKVEFEIPPEDWETNDSFKNPPSIHLLDARADPNVRWDARNDPSVPAPAALASSLDSYTIEGTHARGQATFRSGTPSGAVGFVSETMMGAFDFDCGS
jgi:hypothetical protein